MCLTGKPPKTHIATQGPLLTKVSELGSLDDLRYRRRMINYEMTALQGPVFALPGALKYDVPTQQSNFSGKGAVTSC
jgi:hypothetical protein